MARAVTDQNKRYQVLRTAGTKEIKTLPKSKLSRNSGERVDPLPCFSFATSVSSYAGIKHENGHLSEVSFFTILLSMLSSIPYSRPRKI